MSEFSLRKPISLCHVTKNMLVNIENYLLDKVPDLADIPREKILDGYGFFITDDLGTHKLSHVSDYEFGLLPDRTKKVSLNVATYFPSSLAVHIDFNNQFMECPEISISYVGKNPRGIVREIYEHVRTEISQNSNNNRIFHILPHEMTPLIASLALSPFIISIIRFANGDITIGVICLLSAILLFTYVCIGVWLRPSISFESRRYQVLSMYTKFAFGILVSLVIGIIVSAIWAILYN